MNGPWGHYAKWHKPATTGQILYDYTYTSTENSRIHRDGGKIVVARGWKEGEMRRCCLMGIGRTRQELWGRWWWQLHSNIDVFNITAWYTPNMARMVSFMLCVFIITKIWEKGWDFSSRFWFSFLPAPVAWPWVLVSPSGELPTRWLWLTDSGPFLAHAPQWTSPLSTRPQRCHFQSRLDLGPEQCGSLPKLFLPSAPFFGPRGSGRCSLHFIFLCFYILLYSF